MLVLTSNFDRSEGSNVGRKEGRGRGGLPMDQILERVVWRWPLHPPPSYVFNSALIKRIWQYA